MSEELGHDPELADLDPDDLAVYKPERGERPLWDFPTGTLHRREVAAYELSIALGWGQVPATVLRSDAPFGRGSLQRYVAHDLEAHHFTLWETGLAEVRAQLAAMVVFDALCNNADRKAGHVLYAPKEAVVPALRRAVPAARPFLDGGSAGAADAVAAPTGAGAAGEIAPGRVWLVDHGVTFHVEPKLRTVAWELAGEEVPAVLLADLDRVREGLAGELGARLRTRMSDAEVAALEQRAVSLLAAGRFPFPESPNPYPWPLL
ncbi:MAG: hypothetical protein ACLFS9_10760 [Nitriliruptoraceae bacterium]